MANILGNQSFQQYLYGQQGISNKILVHYSRMYIFSFSNTALNIPIYYCQLTHCYIWIHIMSYICDVKFKSLFLDIIRAIFGHTQHQQA